MGNGCLSGGGYRATFACQSKHRGGKTSLRITDCLFGPSRTSRAISPHNTHTHTRTQRARTLEGWRNSRRWTVSGLSPSARLCWTRGAKETAKMFLLSHMHWPVLVIWVSCREDTKEPSFKPKHTKSESRWSSVERLQGLRLLRFGLFTAIATDTFTVFCEGCCFGSVIPATLKSQTGLFQSFWMSLCA